MKRTIKNTLIASLFALSAMSVSAAESAVYTWNVPNTGWINWNQYEHNGSQYWNDSDGNPVAYTPGTSGDGTTESPYDSVVVSDLTQDFYFTSGVEVEYNLQDLSISSADSRKGIKLYSDTQVATINVYGTTTLNTASIVGNGDGLTFSSTNINLDTGLLSYIDKLTATNITNTANSSVIQYSNIDVENITVSAGTLTLQGLESGSTIDNIEIASGATLVVNMSAVFTTSAINGAGTFNVYNNSSSTITIDGGTGVFTGAITGGYSADEYLSYVNITGGADQSFIGTNTASYLIFTVDTNSKLTLSTAPYTQVNLNGGTFEAYTSGVELSKLNITANNSAIEFDLSNASTETAFLTVGELTSTSDNININLENIEELVDGTDYTLISFDSTDLSAQDFILMTLVGENWEIYTEGEWTISMSGDSFILTNVAVPEPSTYALIFGALALAFTYYRRRK